MLHRPQQLQHRTFPCESPRGEGLSDCHYYEQYYERSILSAWRQGPRGQGFGALAGSASPRGSPFPPPPAASPSLESQGFKVEMNLRLFSKSWFFSPLLLSRLSVHPPTPTPGVFLQLHPSSPQTHRPRAFASITGSGKRQLARGQSSEASPPHRTAAHSAQRERPRPAQARVQTVL